MTSSGPDCICKHCHKACVSLQQFLRHVSHSNSCKLSYGQDYLDKLRKESRINSKRQYYNRLSDDEKKRRYDKEKFWRCANAKKRYVPTRNFTTKEGRTFEYIFKRLFDIVLEETKAEIQNVHEHDDIFKNMYFTTRSKAYRKYCNDDTIKISDLTSNILDFIRKQFSVKINRSKPVELQENSKNLTLAPNYRKPKRKLIIDEEKSMSDEVMRAQLSDTQDIVASDLDLAAPTKELMNCQESTEVKKLLVSSGKSLYAEQLSHLYEKNRLWLNLMCSTRT